jgi:hypothetical protein
VCRTNEYREGGLWEVIFALGIISRAERATSLVPGTKSRQLPLFFIAAKFESYSLTVWPDSRYIKNPKKVAVATLPQAE